MKSVTSWGRLDHFRPATHVFDSREQILQALSSSLHKSGLPFGMGRSYGDVCLNPDGVLWRTPCFDRYLNFNDQTGILRCEAGVLLRDIQRLMIPRGWSLPVTPGTQVITVGGAIANDVHGKNHHRQGSFADHVLSFQLMRTGGEVIDCSPVKNPDWFAATVGGLGLTGLILQVELQLHSTESPWLHTETLAYESLAEFFELADSSESNWEHTVSWIDCMSKRGRGIFMRGNPAPQQKRKLPKHKVLTMPFVPPFSMVNRLTLRPFNLAYFHFNKWQAGQTVSHYESFFYPLDNILEWNRMYGPKGFYQYQCVVPRDVGESAIQAMLQTIARSGAGSFLAVLKTFGNRQSLGMMSFPQPGVTLALDFPNHGAKTLQLLEQLDAIVREARGRIYLAKDARMSTDLLEQGYPKLEKFLNYRDPGISSGLSRRLMGS